MSSMQELGADHIPQIDLNTLLLWQFAQRVASTLIDRPREP